MDNPIVSIYLFPASETLSEIKLDFKSKATKKNELYYRQEVSAMLEKMARP